MGIALLERTMGRILNHEEILKIKSNPVLAGFGGIVALTAMTSNIGRGTLLLAGLVYAQKTGRIEKLQGNFTSMDINWSACGEAAKKTIKIGFVLLVGCALLASAASYANQNSTSSKTLTPIVFSKLDGLEMVQKSLERYPETNLLANSAVRVTNEGNATVNKPYSEQIFGTKYMEFDRTMMTIRCLKLVLDGSDAAYQTFTDGQKEEVKLTRESFKALHQEGQTLLQSRWGSTFGFGGLTKEQMAQAMETALVLGDIGKSEEARKLFENHIANPSPDHDDFHGQVMKVLEKTPGLCSSFDALSPLAKQLLCKTANLAHYGHITHLEGGPSMFSKIKESGIASQDPIALRFDQFVHTCDVAGALGHVNNQASVVYTEPTHKAMQAMKASVLLLQDTSKTETDAYQMYANTRATWLGLNNISHISQDVREVLARLGAMLRLFTPQEGSFLYEGFLSLVRMDRADLIVAQLDPKNDPEGYRTPTYMPAVLVNLLGNANLTKDKTTENEVNSRIVSAMVIGLPFIALVLHQHKQMLDNRAIDPNFPLNFNEVAGVAKSNTALGLSSNRFSINDQGVVHYRTQQ